MFVPESDDQSANIAAKGNNEHASNKGQMSKRKRSIGAKSGEDDINPIERKAEEISNPQLRTKIAGRRDDETSSNAIAMLDLDNAEEASRALVVREHRVAQMDALSHTSEQPMKRKKHKNTHNSNHPNMPLSIVSNDQQMDAVGSDHSP